MQYKMRVVSPKESAAPLFFSYDAVLFDVFFAQVLSWEDEQFMKVIKRSVGAEEKIRFFDAYDCAPEWRFQYKGTCTSALYAFQFNEGDYISFTVRDAGGIGCDLASRLKDSYIHRYVATHIYDRDEFKDFSPEKQYAFTEALRADAREQIKKNEGWLLFRDLELPREWKED